MRLTEFILICSLCFLAGYGTTIILANAAMRQALVEKAVVR